MMGGRRRKSKKGGRKTRKTRGGGWGYTGDVISAGNIVHGPSNTSVPMKPDGTVDTANAAADTATNAHVGGRRRKTKKGAKKGKKSRRTRKMRGGAGVYNSAIAGTGFTGAVGGMPGSQTYGQYTGYSAHVPAGNPHSAGADGVMRV